MIAVVLLLSIPGAAHGAPGDPNPDGGQPASGSLQDQLAAATRAYVDAKGRLDVAVARQQQFQADLNAANVRLGELQSEVDVVVARTYKVGPLRTFALVLDSTTSDQFIARAESLHELTHAEDHELHEINALKDRAAQTQADLDQAVNTARVQTAELDRRKKQIQQSLDVAAGGPTNSTPTGGTPTAGGSAEPAPRNPDGSFPPQSCSVKDPTTTGCLTPRTLHALQQAQAAGFRRFVACYRHQSWGEHPLGRACDFSAQANGFGGVATGADRDYGNRLADWFIANASRLGVLYIIWYHQIWEPSRGWHYYQGDGTPSGDHMNHVHLSEI